MSININLVGQKDPRDSKAEKVRKIKGISFAILFLTAFLAILIFGIDYRFSASYVQKQQANLLSELDNYKDESAKIFIVNSKLSELSKILAQRKKYDNVITQIYNANIDGASIDELVLDEAGISIIVSSNSIESIDKFINSLLELNKQQVINGVALKRLTYAGDRYILEISSQ